jgi:uncharacterized membrane protein
VVEEEEVVVVAAAAAVAAVVVAAVVVVAAAAGMVVVVVEGETFLAVEGDPLHVGLTFVSMCLGFHQLEVGKI